jgi:4-hydroxy-tetrahydrodipicolinate synthase
MQTWTLRGVIPAMVTPRVAGADEIDLDAVRSLVDYFIESGGDAVFAASSTGEAPLLSREQRRTLVEATVTAVAGRVPVLTGGGSPSTRESLEIAADAEAAGATHLVLLPNHFVAVTQEELYRYFATVADSAGTPTLLYNFPARTAGQNIAPSTAARLARSHNVIGIKDSSGDLTNTIRYIKECGDGFAVFTGSESLIYASLMMGAVGTICAGANVYPRRIAALVAAYKNGEFEKARALQSDLVPLRAWSAIGTFPAQVKAAMAVLGHPVGDPFPPVQPLAGKDLDAIRELIAGIGSDEA